ncbi:hypothetical protein BDZ94DRAFT_1323650 [Collybia nuda]|uniref:DUF6534 domain-containing protein n=1 Tax=Collybia nuda TaxID=64659 RepID=A0A9P6CHK5_9AGAR|nr:hypothetical protein BDZ94DRAFT_1323650 [Collybia nuda]
MTEISSTYGAILFGASMAFGLSGIVGTQCVIYFKMYPDDLQTIKALVSAVWTLDLTHTAFICASLAYYFVTHFGDQARGDSIPWSIALTVVVTAIQTFLVQCFFAQKILRSSKNNWYITGPIILLSLLRLLAASVSTVEMIQLHSYSAFGARYPGWVFTTGLSLSAGVDILITGWLYYFLREIRARTGSTIMIQAIDNLTLYTLETGALTSLAAVASLICWLIMPTNLIFLGLHFVIGKLYANSLLASLNTRKELRRMRTGHGRPWVPHRVPGLSTSSLGTDTFGHANPVEVYKFNPKAARLNINVERTILEDDAETSIERSLRRYSRRFQAWERP